MFTTAFPDELPIHVNVSRASILSGSRGGIPPRSAAMSSLAVQAKEMAAAAGKKGYWALVKNLHLHHRTGAA